MEWLAVILQCCDSHAAGVKADYGSSYAYAAVDHVQRFASELDGELRLWNTEHQALSLLDKRVAQRRVTG